MGKETRQGRAGPGEAMPGMARDGDARGVEKRQGKKRRRGRPEKPLKIDDTPKNIARALFGLPSTKFDKR